MNRRRERAALAEHLYADDDHAMRRTRGLQNLRASQAVVEARHRPQRLGAAREREHRQAESG